MLSVGGTWVSEPHSFGLRAWGHAWVSPTLSAECRGHVWVKDGDKDTDLLEGVGLKVPKGVCEQIPNSPGPALWTSDPRQSRRPAQEGSRAGHAPGNTRRVTATPRRCQWPFSPSALP